MALLEIKNLVKYFPIGGGFLGGKKETVKAVDGVSLTVEDGETLGLVGESGCGKSTFAKVLLGLEASTSGDLTHDSTEIGRIGVQQREQKQLAALQIVFQNPVDTLNPSHTVGAQVGRVLKKFGVSQGKTDTREKTLELLAKVKLPDEFYYRLPRQLSGGQKQRVAIARSLCMESKILLFDEPTSALDPEMINEVLDVMVELADTGITMVCVTHEMGFARKVADTMVFMDEGKIIEVAPPDKFFSKPESTRCKEFLEQILEH